MSKQELMELVAPLSPAERRELRELLEEAPEPMTAEALKNDPFMKVLAEIDKRPPADLPSDFAINHDYYLHGGEKREP